MNYESTRIIDEIATTEYYIGVSNNSANTSASTWKIKRVLKFNNRTWTFTYPDGSQEFEWVWNDRLTYSYK